jgi:ATP-dependent DNA helicase RecG
MNESKSIEFIIMINDDICKELIAFANTNGGTLYLGIDDRGNEVGIQNINETYTKLTNTICDTILPDITMFIRYELIDEKIIKVNVAEGSAKPYFLKQKGMKPSGIYIRQGTSSVQASWDQIRLLIKNTDVDSYESARSLHQDLTFSLAENEFKGRGIVFSKEKYVSLGIWNADMLLYTNLALLLSDQCQHSIKAAVFGDTANTIFIDRREFEGSIFKQLHETYNFLMLNNRTASEIRGLDRFDNEDYPPEAIREALLNALIHRDYSFSGSIIININANHMEFINLGGLPPGLLPKDIMAGISQPRNEKLAQIFFRLKHIESYGTGIRRIFELYRNSKILPEIAISENTFRMILPNRNYLYNSEDVKSDVETAQTADRSDVITPQMQSILDYLSKHKTITDQEIMSLLNIKRTRTYHITKEMVDSGIIYSKGRGKNKVYTK